MINMISRLTAFALIPCLFMVSSASAQDAQPQKAQPGEALPPEDLRTIRSKDLIIRKQGSPLEVVIRSVGSIADLTEIEVTRGSTTFTLLSSDIESIVRRQLAGDVYKSWNQWIYKNKRQKKERARAEYSFARWCYFPNADNDGVAPNEGAALEHFEKAVRLDPTIHEAYPFLVSISSLTYPLESAPLEVLDREIETYLLAMGSGYESADMRYRLATILAVKLEQPAAATPHLEFVLESEDAKPGQKRLARAVLARLHFKRGRSREALALYEGMIGADASGDGASSFDALFRSADMRMRLGGAQNLSDARSLLMRAQAVQPKFAELQLDLAAIDYAESKLKDATKKLRDYIKAHPGVARAHVDLALVQMRSGLLADAAKSLAAVSVEQGYEAHRAHIARGLLAEIQGDDATALEAYQSAAEVEPSSPLSPLLVAATLVRARKAPLAKHVLDTLLAAYGQDREIFGACSRLLAELDIQKGDRNKAAAMLEYATDVSPKDPHLLERTGLAFFGSAQPGRGATFLAEAGKLDADRPPSLAGLAYYAYGEGDVPGARLLFDRVLALIRKLPKNPVMSWKAGLEDYAKMARAQIEDLQTLEVWADDFTGTASATIDGWQKSELFGVRVSRKNDSVIFEGTQKNSPDGLTEIRLMRPIDTRSFDRMKVDVQVASGRAMPALHLESGGDRNTSTGVMVFLDVDNKIKVKVQDARSGWKELAVTPEEEVMPVRSRRTSSRARKMVYSGGMAWPVGDGFHTYEIRRGTKTTSRSGRGSRYDVYFDGRVIAKNVTIPGFGGAEFRAVLSGRSDALDNSFSFTFNKFRVYRKTGGRR